MLRHGFQRICPCIGSPLLLSSALLVLACFLSRPLRLLLSSAVLCLYFPSPLLRNLCILIRFGVPKHGTCVFVILAAGPLDFLRRRHRLCHVADLYPFHVRMLPSVELSPVCLLSFGVSSLRFLLLLLFFHIPVLRFCIYTFCNFIVHIYSLSSRDHGSKALLPL